VANTINKNPYRTAFRKFYQAYESRENPWDKIAPEAEAITQLAYDLTDIGERLKLNISNRMFDPWLYTDGKLKNILEMITQNKNNIAEAISWAKRRKWLYKELWNNLQEIKRDFNDVKIDFSDGTISVLTEPIELSDGDNDLYLGSFRLTISWKHMTSGAFWHKCLQAIAVSPNRCPSDVSVTHPHVDSNYICLGDAQAPVNKAMAEGRFVDVFQMAEAVLINYAPDSVYAEISQWFEPESSSDDICSNCASTHCLENCTGCDNLICEDCSRCCAHCEDKYGCSNCLMRCSCRKVACNDCQIVCDGCNAVRCPACVTVTAGDANLCTNCVTRQTCVTCRTLTETIQELNALRVCRKCATNRCIDGITDTVDEMNEMNEVVEAIPVF
jgi:hypothetical protein